MEPGATPTTIIPFTRRNRWRWWMMVFVGTVFATFGLMLLTSPAWSRYEIFGEPGFWLWFRGEAYLIFGFLQVAVGIGYIRLTSRPSEAVIADNHGITVRRIHGKRHLAWQDVTEVHKGRASVLLAAVPVTLWKRLTLDPQLLRIDTTLIDPSAAEVLALITHHRSAAHRLG